MSSDKKSIINYVRGKFKNHINFTLIKDYSTIIREWLIISHNIKRNKYIYKYKSILIIHMYQ